MAKANYRSIPALLKRREAFTGNTMRAAWLAPDAPDIDTGRLTPGEFDEACLWKIREWSDKINEPVFVVWSYGTPIAWALGSDGPSYVTEQRFSVTTSRQQTLCRAYLSGQDA